tara:strand:- start:789 stop:1268 length:480 start_codon:yes stop_codon:yes gene_type:complete
MGINNAKKRCKRECWYCGKQHATAVGDGLSELCPDFRAAETAAAQQAALPPCEYKELGIRLTRPDPEHGTVPTCNYVLKDDGDTYELFRIWLRGDTTCHSVRVEVERWVNDGAVVYTAYDRLCKQTHEQVGKWQQFPVGRRIIVPRELLDVSTGFRLRL